jgi:hypothetical protein
MQRSCDRTDGGTSLDTAAAREKLDAFRTVLGGRQAAGWGFPF